MFLSHPDFARQMQSGYAIVRRWYELNGKGMPQIDYHRSGVTPKGDEDCVVICGPRAILLVAKIIGPTANLKPMSYDEWPQRVKDEDALYRSQIARFKTTDAQKESLSKLPDIPPYNAAPLLPIAIDVGYALKQRDAASKILQRPF